MATIQKLTNKRSISYRVLIRKKGLKPISKTFPNKRAATKFALQVESDLRFQSALGGESNTKRFVDLSKEYRVDRYGSVDNTPVPYESRIRYWEVLFENKNIIDITKNDVSQGLLDLPSRLKSATINKFRGVLSAILSYACKEYDLPDNPVKYIKPLKENNARTRFLSDEERARLFKACRYSHWSKLHLLVLMAITTGARKGELLSLTFSDIDFDRRTAFVKTSKNGQPRVLPLTNEVVTELCKFKDQEAELIFNSELKPDRPMCFTKQWKKVLLQADIEDFRFHDLRHSCASYLAMNGASLLEISDVLGHRQISMTQRYSHLCTNHKARLINKVMSNL